ncbi:uncharacterized protein BDCG_08060 [Blastomyces dermatitidis ER-3]|uniref:Uncharacterized protein n=3 Tax=Blastomyces TaxID=229219 RepID=A0A179UK76_BLAGS|nr:uncharacterized protein BDBG_04253 [Blastomyces gilchristii SLH14081]XP_045272684.1 uncharacterized protein BDCG_08060 [Blastomyces dermatitidis ER-3]EEQ84791.2 hypothetical protein BDCG_08060 [Blastomyces dermatitidis ER-3]EGE83513.1 hypothetical protein BDDG_06457 [Blastomyces dermatitidis ATCC 18188]OAT08290.1 hypothetical protein BDBG_04253 [Blastomyces gilchristii SLH14081]
MANYFAQDDVPMVSRIHFIKSLLTAFKIVPSQRWILDSAKQFLRLQVESAYQQSVIMRLNGDVEGSERVIKLFTIGLNIGPSAHAEIAGLPGKQEHLLRDHILCVGRIMRGKGRFEESKICFQTCSRPPWLPKYKRYLVQSSLADLYCELAYLTDRTAYLFEAEEMVEPQLKTAKTTIRIRQGCSEDAALLVRELLAVYGNLRQLNIVDRLGHVRVLIALARLSRGPEEARKRWEDVLTWNRYYNPSEEEVFTCGVVYLFLCAAWYKLGDTAKSVESFQNAMQVLRRKRVQFLIPGVGTYLFRDACDQIQSSMRWSEDPTMSKGLQPFY